MQIQKAKNQFLRIQNALIAGILFLAGAVISCNKYVDEYGMPYAEYIVKGKVKSQETSRVIENIKVSMDGDTVKTDSEGSYKLVGEYAENNFFDIKFEDIDGAANGEYQNLDTVVQFENPEFTGGDGNWYEGETTTEFDVELNPKE